VHRRNDHDAPVAGLTQRRPRVLREQERAREQHGEEAFPHLLGKLLDRRDVLETGVRHDRVEPPEALERLVHGRVIPFV
jgi:hypothetical protein